LNCGEVLAKADRLLYETTAVERCTTVFFASVRRSNAQFDLCGRRTLPANDHSRWSLHPFGESNTSGGMLPELVALKKTVPLAPGDWLLVFSDGIPEAKADSGIELGDDSLLDVFRRSANGILRGDLTIARLQRGAHYSTLRLGRHNRPPGYCPSTENARYMVVLERDSRGLEVPGSWRRELARAYFIRLIP
jgi:stage II sporulation SpoE-like protein